MNSDIADLSPELQAEFLSFLREVDDQFEVADMQGLVGFIAKHIEQYPALFNLIEINWDFIVNRFERTGEVPPGIRLTRTTTREALNECAYLEQYRRMMRCYEKFATIDRGRVYDASSENYDDEVFAFFLNCYHLKDWIKNDEKAGIAAQNDVESLINSSYPLRLCADICNSHKHLKLSFPRSDEYPRLAKTHYSVHGGTPTTVTVKYEIETSNGPVDAFTLATQCVDEWQSFITSKCEDSASGNAQLSG
jgi:hypothetical protein